NPEPVELTNATSTNTIKRVQSAWAKQILRKYNAQQAKELAKLREELNRLNQKIKGNPEDLKSRVKRGDILKQLGQFNSAMIELNYVIKKDPNQYEAYTERGITNFILGNKAQGEADLTRAIAINPKYSRAYDQRGAVLFQLGKIDQARKDMDEAVRLNPREINSLSNRAGINGRLGLYSASKKDFDRVLKIDPNDHKTWNERCKSFHRIGNYKASIEDSNKAIALEPAIADYYRERGLSYTGLGDYKKAIEDYDRAIDLDPNDYSAYNNKGADLIRLGKFAQARQNIQQAIKLNPTYAAAYNNLGATLHKEGRLAEARKAFDKAVELDPTSASALANRGTANAEMGDFDNALTDLVTAKDNYRNKESVVVPSAQQCKTIIAQYTKLIELDPNNLESRYNRAVTYLSAGDREKAIEDLRAFLELSNWHGKAAVNAGLLLYCNQRLIRGTSKTVSAQNIESVLNKLGPTVKKPDWRFYIIEYLQGRISEKQLLESSPSKDTQTATRFYLALNLMAEKKFAQGANQLKWILTFGDSKLDEFQLAMVESARFKATQQTVSSTH
ncbi:MAG: tetratricopeptide repeat protein, partial [Cyanobacteria bacterium]|nr:tetratricopeptide repeat protein [Cyanobacteriota bacterium]